MHEGFGTRAKGLYGCSTFPPMATRSDGGARTERSPGDLSLFPDQSVRDLRAGTSPPSTEGPITL